MSEVKWIKIVTDIFDDEKVLLIETLPEADSILVIWFKLLCLAGKQNNSGVFIMKNGLPYTDKMLSIIFRRKEATVQLALKTFQDFGMVEIVENAITIPNWGKHQNFDKIELKTQYMRNYMRDYREKQKQIVGGGCAEGGQPDCKANSKSNSKSNVSLADKIRLDKIRKEEEEEEKNYPSPEKAQTIYADLLKALDKIVVSPKEIAIAEKLMAAGCTFEDIAEARKSKGKNQLAYLQNIVCEMRDRRIKEQEAKNFVPEFI